MPVEKTIKLYEFGELSEDVQDGIISKYLQDLPGWWSDDVEERIRNEAASIGIKDFDLSWSGFWSQGDGLSFTGRLDFKNWFYILTERLSPEQFIKVCGKLPHELVQLQEQERIQWGECNIERTNNMYSHENTVSVSEPDSSLGWDERRGYPSDNEIMIKFSVQARKHLEEWKNEICCKWYADLQEAYEAHVERDNIVENIKGHELLFTSCGTVVNGGELV